MVFHILTRTAISLLLGNMKKYLTREGLEKLKQELEYLRETKRKEIAERLEKCIAFGDLTENSEYQETKEEQAFIHKFFETVPFSEAQKQQLFDELENAADINEIYPKITSPEDRGELILFARMMCWADGDFHHQEEEILEKINEKVLNKVDLDHLMHETQQYADEAAKRRAEIHAQVRAEAKEKVGLGAVFGALGDQIKNFTK